MILAAFTLAFATPTEVDLPRLLQAVAQVESGCDDKAVGKRGERGRYQLSPAVWGQHARKQPFTLAHNATESKVVADHHIQWLLDRLRFASIELTPYNIALAWNAGFSAMTHNKLTAVHRDYADRVVNLYNSP